MSDEGKAGLVAVIWAAVFLAGAFMAKAARPLGVSLMIVSTIVLIIILYASGRIEAEQKSKENRLGIYQADCAKRAEAAHAQRTINE
ncbi:MAG: hypothetical protein J6J71_01380 [Prevotella sp.]|nr:hypothetical protein [Prevotella sp.]